MKICGIYDFTLSDMTKPESSRLVKQLSGLVNFSKYREDQVGLMGEFLDKIDELRATADRLENEKADLASKIQSEQAKREAEIPAIEAAQKELRDLKSTAKHMQDFEIPKLTEQYSNAKSKDKELRAEINEAQYAIYEMKGENETRRSQIVRSPARLKKEISNLANEVDDLKNEVSELEIRKRDMTSKVDVITRNEKELTKAMVLMEEIDSEMTWCKSGATLMKQQKAQIDSNRHEMLDLNAEEQSLAKQLGRIGKDNCAGPFLFYIYC